MRTWKYAPTQMLCGGLCRQFIAKGDPYLELAAPEWTRPKARCRHCAGEPVNLEQPSEPAPRDARAQDVATSSMQRLVGAYQPELL